MTEPIFDVVTTTQGALSIRNKRVGEIMHNPLGPWREIQDLYIIPSQLKKRLGLSIKSSDQNLVLYDVGLGAGSNAMGAILTAFKAMKEKGPKIGLNILSFEQDLALAQFALEQQENFPEFSWAWDAFQDLLDHGFWKHPEYPITWALHPGDFTQTLNKSLPLADLIFYDPYSPGQNQEMWTYETFNKLRQKCHSSPDQESLLLTYSRSTSIRAALLLASFYVGHGRGIGLKEETTLASTRLQALEFPLEQRWLDRWRRSHAPFPSDLAEEKNQNTIAWVRKIENHPQFCYSDSKEV